MSSPPTVVIVHLSCSVDDLVRRLPQVAGARLVRELPPDRVVVVLATPDDQSALARLPGVESVRPDPLEHLTAPLD